MLALGAVAAYVMSPKTKGWVDDHVKAIEGAFAAHKVADDHLDSAAGRAPVRGAAYDINDVVLDMKDVQAADAANKVAAHNTGKAGETARTEQERQIVAKSAAVVTARQEKIALALLKLGKGQCGVRPYPKVSVRIKDALLARLKSEGMAVSVLGNNLWEIDTKIFDVILRALWDSSKQTLYLIVQSGKGDYLVTCDVIWGRIDPILKEIIGA